MSLLRVVLSAALLLFVTMQVRAENVLWLPAPQTDATEFGSLAFDPSESLLLPPGRLAVSFQQSYFNQWAGSWHTARVREATGLRGVAFTDEEIRAIDEQFPDDDVYRFDVEGWRVDTLLAFGIRGATISVRIPVIDIGGASGDGVAEEFHSVVPANDTYDRELFGRGNTLVLLRGGGRSVTAREELRGSGVGDIAFALTIPVRRTARWSHTASVSADAPTGDEGTLHGSGGWDAGVRWHSHRRGASRDYALAASWTRLDPNGSFLGIRRSNTWSLYAAVEQRLGSRWSSTVRTRIDSSPLAGVIDDDAGAPAVYYRFGVHYFMNPDTSISVELADEVAPQWGIDADWSAHIAFTQRFAP